MTNPTTPFSWQMPTSTDLVTDLPADFETFGQAVATSMADLLGGTTGQVLAKASNTDMDFTWVAQDDSNAIQNAIVDAKGDLIAASAADTPARLAVGTNGQVLTADSTTATGLKWATAAGGGKVLQVVTGTYSTQTTITSTSYVDTNLTATITPSASTSKILVMTMTPYLMFRSDTFLDGFLQIVRTSTSIAIGQMSINAATAAGETNLAHELNMSILDSPATTSATTYKMQGRVKTGTNSETLRTSRDGLISTIILMEIGA